MHPSTKAIIDSLDINWQHLRARRAHRYRIAVLLLQSAIQHGVHIQALLMYGLEPILQVLPLDLYLIDHQQIILHALLIVLIEDVFGVGSLLCFFHLHEDLHFFGSLLPFDLSVVASDWGEHLLDVGEFHLGLGGYLLGHTGREGLSGLVERLNCVLAGH